MMIHQRTLKSPASIEGVGLFTAAPSRCVIHPAEVDHGLVFVYNGLEIPVNAGNITHAPVHPAFVGVSPRCSALTRGGSTVWLVEHVLSALGGLGVTSATIEVDHCELPIMDGSSLPFVQAIVLAGVQDQGVGLDGIPVREPVRVEQDDAWIEVLPAESCSYEYSIDYGSDSPIVPATVGWDGDGDEYTRRVAPARTFCLKHEAEALQGAGLFGHLEPGDMLVLDESGPIENTLRDEHECAHHKLLDLIGDVMLAGRPIVGRIRAYKSGHALAHEFVRAVLDSQ